MSVTGMGINTVVHGAWVWGHHDDHGHSHAHCHVGAAWDRGDACMLNRLAGVGRLRDGSWAEGSREGTSSIAVRAVRRWVQELNKLG